MTPAAFAATYGPLADEAARQLGHLSRWTILAQWAVETGWGTSSLCVHDHNLAGIRWYGHVGSFQVGGIRGEQGTGFAGYGTLGAFIADYVRTMNLPAYSAVRAAVGAEAGCRALGLSPWDAGHYRSGGVVGGSLLAAWHMFPAVSSWTLHIAHGALVDHYATPAGRVCITNHQRQQWGGEDSSAPCRAPVRRHLCTVATTILQTVYVTAGTFAGRYVVVSPAHGVTLTRTERSPS